MASPVTKRNTIETNKYKNYDPPTMGKDQIGQILDDDAIL